jgi:glycine/D-amino acid oxidase-like deaminating enzyme
MVASDKSGEAQMTELSSKYCIFGAGAIGGTIAAQLARADATVGVIARGETLAGHTERPAAPAHQQRNAANGCPGQCGSLFGDGDEIAELASVKHVPI